MSNNTQHVVFEYASTLTAAGNCTGPKPCFGSSLAKGELCFGKVHNLPGAQCLQWRHWRCMTMKLLRDLRQQVPDPSNIEGFRTLTIEDQGRIEKAWKLGRIALEDVSEKLRESLQKKDHRNTTVEEKELPATRIVLDSHILLHEIFEFVEGHDKSLLALALTCKAFQQPALAILWRHLFSIFPVLRLVSNFESADGGKTWLMAQSEHQIWRG
ncbi:hypothetical protein BJ165DRAFT_205689 [Panaeolus papilionaceus]|nr:hypothetical protein BJ165DRAFT_205689 [Panaeolus papilionaceus]